MYSKFLGWALVNSQMQPQPAGEFFCIRSLMVGSYLKISLVPQENPQLFNPVDSNPVDVYFEQMVNAMAF